MCMSAQSKNSVKFSYIYCVQTSIPSPRYLWPAFEMQVSLESSNWKFPCWIEDGWWNTQRVTTPTNAVSGQSQNCSGNLEISPGIGTIGNFSGKHVIIPGHCRKKSGHRRKFYFTYPKNSGGWSKFPGRLKLRPSIAQTAFVRVVNPRQVTQRVVNGLGKNRKPLIKQEKKNWLSRKGNRYDPLSLLSFSFDWEDNTTDIQDGCCCSMFIVVDALSCN